MRDERERFIFARFHARPGDEDAIAAAIRDVVPPTRPEPGCVRIEAFRSLRDPRLVDIHSRWQDEAAFDRHADLPHTARFLERIAPLIDHPLDVNRTARLDGYNAATEEGSHGPDVHRTERRQPGPLAKSRPLAG